MSIGEPTTERTRRIQGHLSETRWRERVDRAVQRVEVVEPLRERQAGGQPGGSDSRRAVRSAVPRTTLRRWQTWYDTREGEPWERMLDGRLPPKALESPESWQVVVRSLGRQEPQPSFSAIRDALVAEFGPKAGLCDNTIKRILREAGLWSPYANGRSAVEEVVELSGGGALVPLLAASLETGAPAKMAKAVTQLAKAQQSPPSPPPPEPEGRDSKGRLTAEYNRNRLEMLEQIGASFYRPAEEARQDRDLTRLRLATLSPATLARHLLCIAAAPLVTQRRGTVGLDGPAGGWLEVLSPVAYKAATANKTLSELKALGAADRMWESHARVFLELSKKWSEGQGWRQLVDFVDTTYDPWWTHRYAQSGKVSRTGRVQPCLARPMLSSGPGVPIIAHVVSGTAPIKDHLFKMLELADELRGEDTLGRFLVVDSEGCTLEILHYFEQDPRRQIITVLKGRFAEGKSLDEPGEWIPFRQRDRLREGIVDLQPKTDDGFDIRVVEMERTDSRHPKPTWFATTASPEELSTEDVAEAYLSRWPFQEDLFRRGRNGVGLERSHGYGVSKVRNVAVIDKREKAGRKLCKVSLDAVAAEQAEAKAQRQLEETKQRLEQRREEGSEDLDRRHQLGVRLSRSRLKDRQSEAKQAKRKQEKAAREYEALQSMPEEIYVRDTGLDSIATSLKMMLLAMLEFVCQEYLGRRRIMPRTFIEAWLPLPVTIRRSRWQVLYEVAPNPRDKEMTALLAKALARITERRLMLDGRRLVAIIRDGPD